MLTDNTYLCLAVLDGIFCVIFLHGRNSPQSSPTSTPKLIKSLSFEMHPDELIEKPMSPMQYARSGLVSMVSGNIPIEARVSPDRYQVSNALGSGPLYPKSPSPHGPV